MNHQVIASISRRRSIGFALPTVLLASTLMMAVLLLAVQANTAVRAELNAQYYNRQARLASQSGAVRAQQCLSENGSVAKWTDAKPLQSNTDCSGNIIGSYSAYVYNSSIFRTSFSVSAPITTNGVQKVNINGKLDLLRTSTNTPWRTYNQTLVSQLGADISFNAVTFGYEFANGAFFGTIGIDGKVQAVGYNGNGQLGTGDLTNSTSPRDFTLPSGARAIKLFTSFLSHGTTMSALTNDGRVFGSGNNAYGQLGNGSTAQQVKTPVQFNLPTGVKATYVSQLAATIFVFGDDNNIYASGSCNLGTLGSNYTISGCSNKSTAVRVNLPIPDPADLNTIPVAVSTDVPSDNIAVDRSNAYVRMKGGRVYAWGDNVFGQLANGAANINIASSNPIKVGNFGDAGKSKAVQVAFDGLTIYILDSAGDVYAAGSNAYGALGGAPSQIKKPGRGACINNTGNATGISRAAVYDCVNAISQQIEFNPNGSIITRPNPTTNLCLDNANGVPTDNNPVQWYPCANVYNANQDWQFQDNGTIVNVGTGKCLENYNNIQTNNATLNIWTCNAGAPQLWQLDDSPTLTKIPIPDNAGAVTRIATDERSVLFLTASGDVWGAGVNNVGQLGDGNPVKNSNPKLIQMKLPPNRTAKYIYTTRYGGAVDKANSYVILDDGSVYGCGANLSGQLGITGPLNATNTNPVKMLLPAGVLAKQVQSGLATTVILTTTGRIFTLGDNTWGQLGDGTTNNSSVPKANKYTNIIPPTLF